MSRDHISDARGVFRVIETGDTDLARRVVSPAFSNREASAAPPAASLQGPAGLLATSAWLRSAFADLHFELLETDGSGPHVWLRLRMQGEQTGPFVQYEDGRPARVLPPTGRRIDSEQIHLMEVDDTGVLRHEAVRDDITMLGQLGVFPPGPAVLLSGLAAKLSGRERRAVADVVAATERAAAGAATVAVG
jgi:predicted ester cyclase